MRCRARPDLLGASEATPGPTRPTSPRARQLPCGPPERHATVRDCLGEGGLMQIDAFFRALPCGADGSVQLCDGSSTCADAVIREPGDGCRHWQPKRCAIGTLDALHFGLRRTSPQVAGVGHAKEPVPAISKPAEFYAGCRRRHGLVPGAHQRQTIPRRY